MSTFDAGKGIRLATYAARCVENEILMHFRSQRKALRTSPCPTTSKTGKDGTALSLWMWSARMTTCSTGSAAGRTCDRPAVHGEVLDDREQKVLTLRYGLDGKEPLPQREVAQQCNISRPHIPHRKKALEKLRSRL